MSVRRFTGVEIKYNPLSDNTECQPFDESQIDSLELLQGAGAPESSVGRNISKWEEQERDAIQRIIETHLEAMNSSSNSINNMQNKLKSYETHFNQVRKEGMEILKVLLKKCGPRKVQRGRRLREAQVEKEEAEKNLGTLVEQRNFIGMELARTQEIVSSKNKMNISEEDLEDCSIMLPRLRDELKVLERKQDESLEKVRIAKSHFDQCEVKLRICTEKYSRSLKLSAKYFKKEDELLNICQDIKEEVAKTKDILRVSKDEYQSSKRKLEDLSNNIHEQRSQNGEDYKIPVGAMRVASLEKIDSFDVSFSIDSTKCYDSFDDDISMSCVSMESEDTLSINSNKVPAIKYCSSSENGFGSFSFPGHGSPSLVRESAVEVPHSNSPNYCDFSVPQDDSDCSIFAKNFPENSREIQHENSREFENVDSAIVNSADEKCSTDSNYSEAEDDIIRDRTVTITPHSK